MSARRHFFRPRGLAWCVRGSKIAVPKDRSELSRSLTCPLAITSKYTRVGGPTLSPVIEQKIRGKPPDRRRPGDFVTSCWTGSLPYFVTVVLIVTELLDGLGSGLRPPIVIVFVTVPGVDGTLIVM
jgi:hypothetical protein